MKIKHLFLTFAAAAFVMTAVGCDKDDDVTNDNPENPENPDSTELTDGTEDGTEDVTDDWADIDIPYVDFPDWMPDEMPIVGWRGVPRDNTTVANYQIMKEGGFNTNLTFYETESQVAYALEVAGQTGIQLIARWPGGWFNNPATYVPKYDSDPALLGYVIQDEPKIDELDGLKTEIDAIKNAGATKPCYVNLNPYYSSASYTNQGLSSYDEYVDICVSTLQSEFISFDFYPIVADGDVVGVRTTWYENLQIIRDAAIAYGVSFWGFVLSCPHLYYPTPTLEHLRLQINMNLAYGAQAIQYYTYWLPNGEGGNNDFTDGYHDAAIDADGNPTDTYYLLQTANAELKEKAKLFYKGVIAEVAEVTDSYRGAEISAPEGAVGSLLLTSQEERYLVLVNKSLSKDMAVTYEETDYTVTPGDMLLIAL